MAKKKAKRNTRARRKPSKTAAENVLPSVAEEDIAEEMEAGTADDIPTTDIKPKLEKITPARMRIMCERELRRYVKKSGGFRKGLKKSHQKVAEKLMEKLGRKKPEWDINIHIPGIDNSTVAGMYTEHNNT